MAYNGLISEKNLTYCMLHASQQDAAFVRPLGDHHPVPCPLAMPQRTLYLKTCGVEFWQ